MLGLGTFSLQGLAASFLVRMPNVVNFRRMCVRQTAEQLRRPLGHFPAHAADKADKCKVIITNCRLHHTFTPPMLVSGCIVAFVIIN